MVEASEGLRSYKLSPEQLEILLANEYGGKLQPVNALQLAKLKQQQRIAANWANKFSAKPPAEEEIK